MTDYGKGAVLGAATALPATSATGLLFADSLHPLAIAGFIALNVLWFAILAGHISRYVINRRAK